MLQSNESQAEAKNEQVLIFQFSENKQEMQTTFHKGEPWIVAADICQILDLPNVTKALYALDEDEKLTLPIVRAGQTREVNCVNESGLYNLIFKSRKREAKTFRKWVTSEVLPAIRKKGIYAMNNNRYADNFIDARNIPYSSVLINDVPVRVIIIEETEYYSINDYHGAINSRTGANQSAKKLNALETLAVKIWLFGNTHPAWFTKIKGLELLASGSRVLKSSNQLALPI